MSIALTMLEKAVEPSTEKMLSFEKRMPGDSLIRAFNEGTNEVVDEADLKRVKTSLRRPTDIAVIKTESFFVNTVREKEPTPNVVSTDKVPLNFFTLAFSFMLSEPLNQDNYISLAAEARQAMFNGIMSAMYRDPTKALELKAATYLETNKWTNLPTSTIGGVTAGVGAYEMNMNQFVIAAPVVMEELEMFGRMMDMGNIGMAARQRDMATYGRQNSRNLDQYADEMDFYKSNKIVVPNGFAETHFLTPQGSLGLINWVEWDARNGSVVHDGNYTVIQDPFLGFEWGVFIKRDRADVSAQGGVGLERASNVRYDLAASFAFVSPYSSEVGKSPIVKINLTA